MTGRLPDNIAHFARALRRAGLPVGPGDVIDAVEAVVAARIGSREDLYWTLHAVLVRKHEHSVLFEEAFRLFWRRRDLIEALIAQMAPVAPARGREPPKAGALRVREALAPDAPRPRPKQDEAALRATLTVSEREVLKAKDFAQMSTEEVAQARRLIAALALPDDAARTRRFAPTARGRIDPRRSFQRTLRAQGSIDLAFRSPRVRPPPIVALADISGSMAEYSRLFLHFLHALGERRRVHSFVFATRLTNITRELARRDPDEALVRASARARDWEGGTRIAAALHAFNRHWSRRVLGGGAVVLLFTDGLEREVTPELTFEMDRLKRSCRRLVWLNPLLRFDRFEARAAGIRAMLPHVHDFRPIHSLAAMEDLCRALGAGPVRADDPRAWLRRAG
ncbi:VWA containing CoxE family protein [Methylobacterium sp. 4-46]|uniref:vWA domain-containing protein n=1 Tax=unclassified Methylobacterium TaxID=2615210 RepID=UPI000165CD59|nr:MULTISPECIES: VWA domain-containing protein [unclassified Methylobacterium]ACA19762.1 VWA containing CoxE family protein [Methylobacterium sp. 4-46]